MLVHGRTVCPSTPGQISAQHTAEKLFYSSIVVQYGVLEVTIPLSTSMCAALREL